MREPKRLQMQTMSGDGAGDGDEDDNHECNEKTAGRCACVFVLVPTPGPPANKTSPQQQANITKHQRKYATAVENQAAQSNQFT